MKMNNTELYGEEFHDTELYLKGMWEVRDRINLVSSVVARQITVGREDFAAELIFLQFRKVLELIPSHLLLPTEQSILPPTHGLRSTGERRTC
jgi:hypothetical protein